MLNSGDFAISTNPGHLARGVHPAARVAAVHGPVSHNEAVRDASRHQILYSAAGNSDLPLTERDDALGHLKDAYRRSADDGGEIVIVFGPTASGKTALLTAFEDWVLASGGRTLHAVGASSERSHPLGGIRQILEAARDAARTERAGPASRRAEDAEDAVLRQAPAATDDGKEPHWSIDPLVKDQIVKEIVSLAADRPLVLSLDDADLVDPQSLSCLAYLLRRIRSARVMAVISLQSEGESALRALYAELLRLPNAHSVRLRHLSQRGVEQLMAAGLGRTTARLLAEDCAEATGGNPLLVRSLIEDYQPTADAAPRLTFGEGFTQAVLRCLYRHDPAVMQVAHAVAILGKSASPQTLARFLGVDEHAVTRAAGALGKTGLLLDYAFRHPAVRHVVLHHVGTDDLAQLHRRGAYLLNDEGADYRRVAEQLLAADWAGEDWAVAALRKAAAAAPDAPTAVRYLRTAARAAGSGAESGAITALLAAAEWRLDPAKALRYLPEILVALREGEIGEADGVAVVPLLLWHGMVPDAVDVLKRLGTREVLDEDLAIKLGELRVWLSYLAPYDAPRIRLGTAPGPSPVNTGRPDFTGMWALACLKDGPDPAKVSAIEQNLRTMTLEDSAIGVVAVALDVLIASGRLVSAGRLCERLLREARRRGLITWQAVLTGLQAKILLWQGDAPGARISARAALATLPRASWSVAVGGPSATLVLAETAMGQAKEALREVRLPVPETIFRTSFGLAYLHARAHNYLAVGWPQAALRNAHMCGKLMREWNLDRPELVPWRSTAGEALMRLGDPSRARRLIECQMDLLDEDDHRTRGMTLRALARTLDTRQQSEVLRDAIEALERAGDPLQLASTLADLGQVCTLMGRTAEARALHRRAEQVAGPNPAKAPRRSAKVRSLRSVPTAAEQEQVQVPQAPPVPRAQQTRSRVKAQSQGKAGSAPTTDPRLSDAERRVAHLAAKGLPNRAIAEKLYITVSTVEQHLTRVYRKLNVKQRGCLSGALLEEFPGS